MNRAKELKKNTMILSIGILLPKIITFLTLPIITAALTKKEYGTYDLILTLVTLLIPIATFQIQSAAFRFLIDCRNNYNKKSEIITNILFFTIPISIIISLLLLFLWHNYNITTRIIISLYFMIDITYITISQIARGLSYNKLYSISSSISSIINLLCIVITLYYNNYGLNGAIFSLLISNIFAVLYLTIKIKIHKYIKISLRSKKVIKEMIKYSWPMIPNNLSGWTLSLSDRLVITHYLGLAANGVYAIANKIPSILSIAQNVFVMAWQENASLSVRDKDSDIYFSNMFSSMLNLVFGVGVLIIVFSPVLFVIFIRGDYNRSFIEIPVLIMGMIFNVMSSFLGGIYIAHKKTINVGLSTIFAAIINIAVDVALIKKIGISAGSISTLISYFVLYTYRMIDIRNFQKMYFKIKNQFIYIIILLIMIYVSCTNGAKINYISIVNMIFGSLFCIYINKELIKNLLIKKGVIK